MVHIDTELCTGCSMCVPVCGEEAITCFGYAEISDACTQCLACVSFCPYSAIEKRDC